jgi:hypothetical protein
LRRDGRGTGGRGGTYISATVARQGRGPVGADGMARPPPTAPMRQPRHQHGEGGGARVYGSSASPHRRERRERTPLLQTAVERRHAPCALVGWIDCLRPESSASLSTILSHPFFLSYTWSLSLPVGPHSSEVHRSARMSK